MKTTVLWEGQKFDAPSFSEFSCSNTAKTRKKKKNSLKPVVSRWQQCTKISAWNSKGKRWNSLQRPFKTLCSATTSLEIRCHMIAALRISPKRRGTDNEVSIVRILFLWPLVVNGRGSVKKQVGHDEVWPAVLGKRSWALTVISWPM